MSELLEGKAAVVTGGSRGIGRAVATALAAHGAAVVVNGREDDVVQEVAGAIAADGGRALGCSGSVADFGVAGEVVGACVREFGGIDVLVNCAGVVEPPGTSILDLDFEDWEHLIGVHLTSVFNTCRHASPHMARRGSGSIINTSSHAYTGAYGGTGYPAGKGGTNSLTFAIAAELREHGVRVNAICPGAKTRISSGPEYERHIQRLHARGVLDDATRDASLAPAPPELVAPLYVALASDLTRDVTGCLFSAAGGYVGRHASPSERLIDYRSEADGPAPVDELAEKIRDAG